MRVQKRRSAEAWVRAMWGAAAAPAGEKAQAVAQGAPAPSGTKAEEPTKPVDAPKLTAGTEGFALQSSDGAFRLQLRGYVHFDGRFFPSDEGRLAVDTFLLRRVRPIF